MSALSYTVPLHRGESYRSFASRLAAANGSRAMLEFCRDMSIDLNAMGRGEDAAFDHLVRLGGVEGDDLRRSAIINEYPYFMLGGQKITRNFVPLSRLRVCPACIRDDMETGEGPPQTRPWLRSAWSVKLVRTCPKHRTLLVEPAVDVPVYFRHDAAVICQNREAMSAMSVVGEPVPASPFEDWMATRLDGRPSGSDFLASLAFHAAVRFTEVIGASAVFGKSSTIADFTQTQFVDAGRAGFAITAAGPDSIRAYLDGVLANFRQTVHLGGKIMLGSLYAWLGQTKDGDIDPLRDLVRDYPIGPGDRILGTVTRRRWHSIHTAFKESGIHQVRLRKLLVEAGIVSREDAGLTDHKIKFDAETVTPLLRQWRDGLTKKEAQAHAGMSYSQLKLLVQAGFIRPLVDMPGSSRVDFSRQDIDAFLASVLYDTANGDPTGMVDVTKATQMAQCFLADIVQMVVDRRLARVALSPSRKGFAGLLVDPKEVLALLPPKREKKGLTTAEACKQLGLNEDVLRALMAAGHIPTIPTGKFAHGREVCHIPEKDAEAFAARYASL